MGGNAGDLFFYKTIALEEVCEADISEESGAGFRSASLVSRSTAINPNLGV
jgi:hypothetical protein